MNGLSSEVYNEGEFEKYDKYNSEDLMRGKMNNGCQFEMSEVLTEDEEVGSESKDK